MNHDPSSKRRWIPRVLGGLCYTFWNPNNGDNNQRYTYTHVQHFIHTHNHISHSLSNPAPVAYPSSTYLWASQAHIFLVSIVTWLDTGSDIKGQLTEMDGILWERQGGRDWRKCKWLWCRRPFCPSCLHFLNTSSIESISPFVQQHSRSMWSSLRSNNGTVVHTNTSRCLLVFYLFCFDGWRGMNEHWTAHSTFRQAALMNITITPHVYNHPITNRNNVNVLVHSLSLLYREWPCRPVPSYNFSRH